MKRNGKRYLALALGLVLSASLTGCGGGAASGGETGSGDPVRIATKPMTEQYRLYLGNLLQGDLGVSYKKPGVTVVEVIRRAWPMTAALWTWSYTTAAWYSATSATRKPPCSSGSVQANTNSTWPKQT